MLARELPPVTVYVDDDLEGIVGLYASTYPRPVELSRQIWQTATAVASPRRIWVYTGAAAWVAAPDWTRVKILAHESFHLMQYELAGAHALDANPDDIPPVGPQWALEGAAEYVAHKAIAEAGLVRMADIRSQWIRRTKLMTSPLRSRETSRGFFAEGDGYQISPLAIDFLLGGRSDALLVTYLESIGHGQAWQAAFAAAFGKTVDVFYADFEAYRATF
jgi:hypothetical protein